MAGRKKAPSLPRRPGRRDRRRAETRERLFRAALRLFAERGFGATTVEDITEAADVGKGTFFNYFPSKEHVLAAFGEMQVGKLAGVVGEPAAADQPLGETLRRAVVALAEEPGRSPDLVRALVGAMMSSAAVRELMLANLRRGRELLGEALAQGQRRGEVRPDLDPREVARELQQAVFGALVLWALDPSATLSRRLEAMAAHFWSGLGATGRSRRARR